MHEDECCAREGRRGRAAHREGTDARAVGRRAGYAVVRGRAAREHVCVLDQVRYVRPRLHLRPPSFPHHVRFLSNSM